jgi:hypothetical protein
VPRPPQQRLLVSGSALWKVPSSAYRLGWGQGLGGQLEFHVSLRLDLRFWGFLFCLAGPLPWMPGAG